MNLRVITPPEIEPLTVELVKTYLRVDLHDDNALIVSLIQAAREKGEEIARRAFITQTLEMSFDNWPAGDLIEVLRPPLQSVESVKYVDSDGVEHTWTDYQVDTQSEPGKIYLETKPSANLLASGAIRVRYVAGYGDTAASVPERIKRALLVLIAYFYESRELGDVPAGIAALFQAERGKWY